MLKLASIIYFAFLFFSTSKSNQGLAQPSTDSVFINWNKATLESLNRQKNSTTDSVQKAKYENRLLATKEYWNVRNVEDLNRKSIRYNLLTTILKDPAARKNGLYVIEANESGSKVLLRSFVLHMGDNTVDVEFYDFINSEWQKTGQFKKVSFRLRSDLKSYITPFGKGFNYDDVIITEFTNNQVKESEYYLYSTLSTDSKIKDVLDGYRKENFLK